MITYFRKCPGCNNAVGGETVYQCTECRKWYCDKCKDIGKHRSGSWLEGRCPRCGAGETNDAYECGTVDRNRPVCTHEWGSGCNCYAWKPNDGSSQKTIEPI